MSVARKHYPTRILFNTFSTVESAGFFTSLELLGFLENDNRPRSTVFSVGLLAAGDTLFDAVKSGPLLVIPITVRQARKDVLFAVVFLRFQSDADLQNARQRSETIVHNHATGLFAAFALEEVAWHKDASRVLSLVATQAMRRYERERHNDDDADRSLNDIRNQVWARLRNVSRSFVSLLRPGMRLDRCAFLSPSQHHGLWTFLTRSNKCGFPEAFLRRATHYSRDLGLTGCVLAANAGESIFSDDVENDKRFVPHNHSLTRGPGDKGPMCFLGVPIYSLLWENGNQPFGAIICCRFRGDALENSLFTSAEITHLTNVASVFSGFVDAALSETEQRVTKACEKRLYRIWSQSASEKEKCTLALSVLEEASGLTRFLLSLVSYRKREIYGVSAVGFPRGLVDLTRRPFFPKAAPDGWPEDVLSAALREQKDEWVIPVDSNDTSGHLSKKIDQIAATMYGVNHALLLLRIESTGLAGRTLGILLAELPPPTVAGGSPSTISDSTLRCLKHLCRVIANEIQKLRVKHQSSYIPRLLAKTQSTPLAGNPFDDKVAVSILRQMERVAGGTLAYLYAVDFRSLTLQAACSTVELGNALHELVFDLRSSKERGLALAAYHSRKWRFVKMDAPIVCPVRRQKAMIPADVDGIAMPLVSSKRCYGTVVICGKSLRTHNRARRLLKVLSSIAGARLEAIYNFSSAQASEKELSSHQAVARVVQSLVEKSGRTEKTFVNQKPSDYDLLLTHIAAALQASAVALHFVTINPGSRTFSPQVLRMQAWSPEWLSEGPEQFRSCSLNSQDLVSTVLRSSSTLLIPDLVESKVIVGERLQHESQSVAGFETLRFLRERFSGSRISYMGIPVRAALGSESCCVGVLSVFRNWDNDPSKQFSQLDRVSAERVASILSLGVGATLVPEQVKAKTYQLIRWFFHHINKPIDNSWKLVTQTEQTLCASSDVAALAVEAETALNVDGSVAQNVNPTVEAQRVASGCQLDLRDHLRTVASSLNFVSSAIAAYSEYAASAYVWVPNDIVCPLKDILTQCLTLVDADLRNLRIDTSVECAPAIMCTWSRYRVVFLLHTIVENAVKALQCSRGQLNRKITIRAFEEADLLRVEVEDNGIGMSPNVRDQAFDEFFSAFPVARSSGLGLTVVRAFVRSLPGGDVAISRSEPGLGTCVSVILPKLTSVLPPRAVP